MKLNNADGSVTIAAKVNNRRELQDDGSCARYLLEGDVRCCFDEVYGDVSGNCGISSFGKSKFKKNLFLLQTKLKFSCLVIGVVVNSEKTTTANTDFKIVILRVKLSATILFFLFCNFGYTIVGSNLFSLDFMSFKITCSCFVFLLENFLKFLVMAIVNSEKK